MYKKSQTTSTKCQYKIPPSNPKWWLLVRWYAIILQKATPKKIVPIITCNPWNPVPKKNMYQKHHHL